MSNIDYISDEEMKVIENIKIDKNIENKIKNKNDSIVYRELLNKALDNVRSDLVSGECIEEYIIGRDYKSDTTRIAVSGVGTYIAHPIFDWSSRLVSLNILNASARFSADNSPDLRAIITNSSGISLYPHFVSNNALSIFKALASFSRVFKSGVTKSASSRLIVELVTPANSASFL